jgi:hypothetical protein
MPDRPAVGVGVKFVHSIGVPPVRL